MITPINEIQYARDQHRILILEARKYPVLPASKSQQTSRLNRLGAKLAGWIDRILPEQNRLQHQQTIMTAD